ncbi:MAG: Atxe2 family lasso peptide isopeptidase [Sphingopyxis terrae]|nr:Atxe2 family lasso peptide isopeptidase [Sphingopyxis terrae]
MERDVSVEDISRIRDIGVEGEARLGFSPSGDSVVFALRRADPSSNATCSAVVLLDLRKRTAPLVMDDGGDLKLREIEFLGKFGFPTGVATGGTPKWAPSGNWFAYLKREGERTGLWIAGPGIAPKIVSKVGWDVADFAFQKGRDELVVEIVAAEDDRRRALELEGRRGFHFDDRFSPMTSSMPFALTPPAKAYFIIYPRDGETRPAASSEWIEATADDGAVGGHGAASRVVLDAFKQHSSIRFRANGGELRDCPDPACVGRVGRPWWSNDGSRIYFLRQEGWAYRTTALYAWNPQRGRAVRRFSTNAVLSDCADAIEKMVCLREDTETPSQIVEIDYHSGKISVLFDANPELAARRLGLVRTLAWPNNFGLQCYGHLVLPSHYRRGDKYPLVIVGYEDRGFLRGGTGDEYPIYAFAAAGFAVLSYNRPPMLGIERGAKTFAEIQRLNLEGDQERESILSCVEGGVQLAIASGVIDDEKIGITGFSDGATTAQYALINRGWVKAAALSHGSWEPNYALGAGPSSEAQIVSFGFPPFDQQDALFWRRNSLRINARRIGAPILFQVPEKEFLSAIEAFTALRNAGKPVDMFVFPGEFHVKWQPAHRLAIYKRSIDWFSFWLKGSTDGANSIETAYWETLRLSGETGIEPERSRQ